MYSETGGWNVLADSSNFQGLGKPSVDDGTVAFGAKPYVGIGEIYIYSDVDGVRLISGGGIDNAIDSAVTNAGNVVFRSQFGITTYIGGILRVIVAPGKTRAPGDGIGYGAEFTDAGGHSISGSHVAFHGVGPAGVYTDFISGFEAIADTNTPIPGGTGNFTSFLGTLVDGRNVAFRGLGDFGQDGLYTNIGGALSKVISAGDLLDDKVVSSVLFWRKALAGNQIAFKVFFTDGSTGIYIAKYLTAHIESIVSTTIRGSKGQYYGLVTVTVFDNGGNPVSDADVTGTFTGDYNDTPTVTTDGNGMAIITTMTEVKKPTYEFCVDDVTHSTLPYSPGDNVETCGSY